jgi:hypothetical protein
MNDELRLERLALRIRKSLLADITDRRGLRQAWESIDEDVQEDILHDWRDLIWAELRRGE